MGSEAEDKPVHAIREACPEDAGALSALSIEVWLHTYCRPAIPPIFAAYALEAFSEAAMRDRIADPHHHLLVEWVDYAGQSALRGYLAWSDRTAPPLPDCPNCEIITLYVRERHKGLGIGSALLEAGYQAMREAGHTAAYLTPNSDNREAISFYRHKNFREIGETLFEIDGAFYPNLVMEKRLY